MPKKKVKKKKKEIWYDLPKGLPGDKRHKLWARQRKKRGFDDREMWSLDSTLARYIYPRLVRYKEVDPFVRDQKEFHDKLDEAIWVFKWLGEEDRWNVFDKEIWERVDKALKGFADIFVRLWT